MEDDDDVIMDRLSRIEQKIETLLPLWANGDTPTKALIDFEKAKTGLAVATNQPQNIAYDTSGFWHHRFQNRKQLAWPVVVGEGTDKMQFLMNSLEAGCRMILMDGKHPRDEITLLLQQKLEILEKKIQSLPPDEGATTTVSSQDHSDTPQETDSSPRGTGPA